MNQAAIYSKNNGLQRTDAEFVIENFFRLLQWGAKENILDIGSGDGGVCFEFLLPKIPNNFQKFIGSDISEDMVCFAKTQNKDPRINFISLDISTAVDVDFHEFFNHIFSFYCLHWVPAQRQAVKNIFDMLKPGGEVLLTFLAKNPIYDIYEKLSKSNKWALYMTNVQKIISPYHHSQDPELEFRDLLRKQGFKTQICRCEKRTYTFPNFSVVERSVYAINPFIKNLPKEKIQAYIRDYIEEVRKVENILVETGDNNNGEEKIQITYELLIVLASKPL